jgi:hypothetical protein
MSWLWTNQKEAHYDRATDSGHAAGKTRLLAVDWNFMLLDNEPNILTGICSQMFFVLKSM